MSSVEAVLAGEARWHLHLGDCREWLAGLGDRSVAHVITDPPYENESHTKSRRSHRGPPGDRGGFVEFPISFDPISPELRAACGAEFARICSRWTIIFCQLEGVRPWRDSCEPHLSHRRTCIWVKPDGAPQFTGDRPGTGYECFEVLHRAGRSRWNGGGRRGVFVHNCNSQTRKPDEDHQTPKPIALMLELVELFTDPGDIICDPFAGSGTTAVAALRLGRRFIGCELDPKYHAIALERIQAEVEGSTLVARRAGQGALFS